MSDSFFLMRITFIWLPDSFHRLATFFGNMRNLDLELLGVKVLVVGFLAGARVSVCTVLGLVS